MAGLVPAIHVLIAETIDVDARHKAGHDEGDAMLSRTERTPFADWWWTIDRLMLAALVPLMLGGIVLSLAASPPVAARIGLDAFHFVHRHVLYLAPAFAVLIATSFLGPRSIRRVAFIVFAVSLALTAPPLW